MEKRDQQQSRAVTKARDERASAAGGSNRYAEFSGLAIFVLCIGVGMLLAVLGSEPHIPRSLWVLMLIVCLVAAFLASVEVFGRSLQLLLYAIAVLSSWSLLMSHPEQGMLMIILVLVAAIGSYIVPMPLVLGLVASNTAVLTLHMGIHGLDLLNIVINAVFTLVIHLAAVFSTYALYRESEMRQKLEQKNVELEAAGILLEDSAATAERLRISRELHDAIGHQLTVLNLELEAAKHRMGQYDAAPAELPAHIERAGEVAKELLSDVRSTVGELRDSEPGDLQTRLSRLASAVPSLEIYVETEDLPVLDDQQIAALVRAAQEIITNTVKHAAASELSLIVNREGAQVVLTGSNDGITPKTVTPGHGLTGLRERAELLGGQLSVSSSPQFTVRVHLPIGEEDS